MKYTLGKQFMYSNGQQYIGYYHKIKGKFYTGKKYISGKSIEIFLFEKNDIQLKTHQYVEPFNDFIKKRKINYQQFQLVTYPKEQLKQIYNVYILYNILDNQIYDVKEKTFNKYKNNPYFKKYKIKLKKEVTMLEYSYNINNISKINNNKVKKYLNNIKNQKE